MPKQLTQTQTVVETVYVGIDPGKQGGLAVLVPITHPRPQPGTYEARATSMPETELEIWQWLKQLADSNHRLVAVIEKVHSMPKQGVVSMFTFGRNYGTLRMALTAVGAVWEAVAPEIWQRGLNIPLRKETTVQRKLKLKEAAQRLFPQLPVWREPRSLGKQKAVCDALLLAEYCRRTMK